MSDRAGDLTAEEKAAVLQLVRRLLEDDTIAANTTTTTTTTSVTTPTHYHALSDGYALYAVLHRIAPDVFVDMDEMVQTTTTTGTATSNNNNNNNAAAAGGGRTSWVIRKGNLLTLLRHMNEYAHAVLGPPADFSLAQAVHAGVIADSAALQRPDDDNDNNNNNDNDNADQGPAEFARVAELFVVMVVFCGVADVMQSVRALPRAVQVTLSHVAKAALARHKLRPLRRYDTPSRAPSTFTTRHASALRSAGGRQSVHAGRPSPSRAAGHVSNHHNSSSSVLRSNAGDATTAAADAYDEPLVADVSYYRNATTQLRKQLAETAAQLRELQTRYDATHEQQQSWESKYRQLLQEHGTRAVRDDDDAAVLRERCAQKDDAMATLTRRLDDVTRQLAESNDTVAARDAALLAQQRKLRSAEEALLRQSDERRQTHEQLAIAQDKLALQMAARAALEGDVERLQSQLELAQLLAQQQQQQQQTTAAMTAGANNAAAEQLQHELLAVNGSLDRVVVLERELDEARSECASLRRQLHEQQQREADESAAAAASRDALQAQLRDVTASREALQAQLDHALSQLATTTSARIDDTAQASDNNVDGSVSDATATPTVAAVTTTTVATATAASSSLAQEQQQLQRERGLLASLLMQYGAENVRLRQQQTLLQRDRGSGRCSYSSGSSGARRHDIVAAHRTSSDATMSYGSLLTRQRRAIVRGLHASILCIDDDDDNYGGSGGAAATAALRSSAHHTAWS